jgi:hypothetical protein
VRLKEEGIHMEGDEKTVARPPRAYLAIDPVAGQRALS